jgi:hypothetical protein
VQIAAAQEALGLLYGEKRARFEARLAADAQRFPERAGHLQELAGYLLPRWEHLFTARQLRRSGVPGLPPHISGTGGVERNVGTVVGHRLKGRGMGWTVLGADHILRLRQIPLLQDF